MDASGLALVPAAALGDGDDTQHLHLNQSYHTHHYRRHDGGRPLKELGIQRSYSMPPAMFEAEELLSVMFEAEGGISQSSRNRERSGICIQRNQASSRQLRQHMLESRSEDQLTTSGGREGDMEEGGRDVCEEGEEGKEGMSEGYPRGRRNAFRGTRVTRRATCAADGHMIVAAGATGRNSVSDRPA